MAAAFFACCSTAAWSQAPAAASAAVASNAVAANEYKVKPGQNLTTISREIAAREGKPFAEVEKTLRDANHGAFIGGNPNRLRTDTTLHVPDSLLKPMVAPQATPAPVPGDVTPDALADALSNSAAMYASTMSTPVDAPWTSSEPAQSASASLVASSAAANADVSKALSPKGASNDPAAALAPMSSSAALVGAAMAAGASGVAGASGAAGADAGSGAASGAASAVPAAHAPASAMLRWLIPVLVLLGFFLTWYRRRGKGADEPVPPVPAAPSGAARNIAGAAGASAKAGSKDAKPVDDSGRAAGRREVDTLEGVHTTFTDREEAALHAQLARAPRDVGALFGLLQLHARRGERAEVERFAHALWDETDAEGELWRRAAALGRKVDPDNPLYSDDPFTALAEHAAKQPKRAVLPIEALDLSLPDTLGAVDSSAVRPVTDAEGSSHAPHMSMPPLGEPADASAPSSSVASFEPAPDPAFDPLNPPRAAAAPSALPASFAGLDLNLGDADAGDTAAAPGTESANAPARKRQGQGRPRRGKGVR